MGKKNHDRLIKAFWEENLFTKAGNGDLRSDEFLSLLGYQNPKETMHDYLANYLTLDEDFLWFAEKNYKKYNFVLLLNDIKEWSKYLFKLYGLNKYFKKSIVSGNVHMRKPESQIFLYVTEQLQCNPKECIFIDNSVKNLDAAQKSTGINTVLFNRDNEIYTGNIINNFKELDRFLEENNLV